MQEFYLTIMRRVAERLKQHLFPGDGLEAAALLLCTQMGQCRKKWLARDVVLVPYERCICRRDFVTWPATMWKRPSTAPRRAASAGVIELIARMFPFRQFPNEGRARSIFMLAEGDEDVSAESQLMPGDRFPVALGATSPLLGLPALTEQRRVA